MSASENIPEKPGGTARLNKSRPGKNNFLFLPGGDFFYSAPVVPGATLP